MRCLLALSAAVFSLISGCGQAEPDRYKTKFTERPSKSVPPASGKEGTKEKGPEAVNQGKTNSQEKPMEPAKGK